MFYIETTKFCIVGANSGDQEEIVVKWQEKLFSQVIIDGVLWMFH